jgi:hypothetical protein
MCGASSAAALPAPNENPTKAKPTAKTQDNLIQSTPFPRWILAMRLPLEGALLTAESVRTKKPNVARRNTMPSWAISAHRLNVSTLCRLESLGLALSLISTITHSP